MFSKKVRARILKRYGSIENCGDNRLARLVLLDPDSEERKRLDAKAQASHISDAEIKKLLESGHFSK